MYRDEDNRSQSAENSEVGYNSQDEEDRKQIKRQEYQYQQRREQLRQQPERHIKSPQQGSGQQQQQTQNQNSSIKNYRSSIGTQAANSLIGPNNNQMQNQQKQAIVIDDDSPKEISKGKDPLYQESCPKCEVDGSKFDQKNQFFWLDLETNQIVYCHRCFIEHYQINILSNGETAIVDKKIYKKVRVCLYCLRVVIISKYEQHNQKCQKQIIVD
ncbi:hypothetical protein pb186bvf_012974 [Paramecium bursaria]